MKPGYLAVAVLIAALIGGALYSHYNRPQRDANNDLRAYENSR